MVADYSLNTDGEDAHLEKCDGYFCAGAANVEPAVIECRIVVAAFVLARIANRGCSGWVACAGAIDCARAVSVGAAASQSLAVGILFMWGVRCSCCCAVAC